MNPARRPRALCRFASLAACVALGAASPAARAADETEPAYFSARVGGWIDRVAAAPDGGIVVGGWTETTDLAAEATSRTISYSSGPERGFLFASRLSPAGAQEWTTFVPVLTVEETPTLGGLAVGDDGTVWLGGFGTVEPIPERLKDAASQWDGVVAKIAPDGTLLFATHVGGNFEDWVTDLAVLPNGDVVLVGTTRSQDFLSLPPSLAAQEWRFDAFVARFASDGAGVVWGRRYGAAAEQNFHRGLSVDVDRTDPSGETILAGFRGFGDPFLEPVGPLRELPGVAADPRTNRWSETSIVRLDAAGEWIRGIRIRRELWMAGGDGLAVSPGGGVFVTFPDRVASLPASLLQIDAVTAAVRKDREIEGICALPGGGVLVPEYDCCTLRGALDTRIRRLDADLAPAATTDPGDLCVGFLPDEAIVDARGHLVVAGMGTGVSFNAPTETRGPPGGYVARIPWGGHRPPSRLRARPEGTEGAVLLWPRDGDACDRFEIECVVPGAAPEVVGTAGRDASGVRVQGLRPGTRQKLRVVSVFPNGVRTAGPLREIVTRPAAPLGVVATAAGDQTVEVKWDDPNGDAVGHEIQIRVGDGPWSATGVQYRYYRGRLEPVTWVGGNPHLDRVPDVEAPLRWRVRSTYRTLRSPWVESNDLLLAPSLRMALAEGTYTTRDDDETEFSVEGTLTAAAPGAPIDFVPATEDVRLVFGRAEAPDAFVVPAGDLGWRTGTDGVHRWSAQRTLVPWHPDSEFALDPATGRFSLRFVGVAEPVTQWVSVGIQFGAWRGGDLRTWTGSVREPLSLRLAPDAGKADRK